MTKRILYVDDEDDIREVAQISLELSQEFDVRSVSSGPLAIGVALDWRPDIILLDVMMPGMDGPETLRRLAGTPATARIPVVFVTARTQRQEVADFLAMGARAVIAKPFDPMTLAAEVAGVLVAPQQRGDITSASTRG